MLTITANALDLVRRIPDHPMLPSTAGLRISLRVGADGNGFAVAASAAPEAGDKILDYGGGRVFLGGHACTALKDRMLDARTDERGRIQFLVTRAE